MIRYKVLLHLYQENDVNRTPLYCHCYCILSSKRGGIKKTPNQIPRLDKTTFGQNWLHCNGVLLTGDFYEFSKGWGKQKAPLIINGCHFFLPPIKEHHCSPRAFNIPGIPFYLLTGLSIRYFKIWIVAGTNISQACVKLLLNCNGKRYCRHIFRSQKVN